MFRAVSVFILPFLVVSTTANARVYHVDANDKSAPADYNFPKKWLSNLFYETLANFSVSDGNATNAACHRQTQMYVEHLANDSYWAVQMSDSWSLYPIGILTGTTHQMGVYDECISVQHPVRGKYCIPTVQISSTAGIDFSAGNRDQSGSNDHAWQEILGFIQNGKRSLKNNIKFGICIPDSCTAFDLETSLQRKFDKHFLPHQVKAQVKVESITCSTNKDMYPFDTGFYLTSFLVGSIVLICGLSTAYHLSILIRSGNGKRTHKIPKIFSYFSVIRNGRDLIKYDKNNKLNIFNGIKVLTMGLVLFGHKFMYFIINPIMYTRLLEQIYETGPDFLLTCMNLVDPFFYMAGYLMYVTLVPRFSKPETNWFQIPMVIVYKYSRMLPAYGIMMLLTAFVVPHLGDGPFWASRIWPEADKCKQHWWTNLILVSNFIKVENQCLIVGWYISCLLQFLIIGTVVIYIYVKNRRIGISLIVLLLCVSLVVPYVLTYINRAYGIIRLLYSFLEYPGNSFEYNTLYRPFYLRGTPFFIGLLAGMTVEELNLRETKLSTTVVYIGTLVVTAVCFWVQLYGSVFYDLRRHYNVTEQSLYATLSHCTWAIILFWVTVCHFTSGYGPIEKLFNNRFVVPLGRLSYAVYLVNITVMMTIESVQRTAVFPSKEFLFNGWVFGVFRTYLVGILLYLTVEAPCGLLIKKIFNEKRHSKIIISSNIQIKA